MELFDWFTCERVFQSQKKNAISIGRTGNTNFLRMRMSCLMQSHSTCLHDPCRYELAFRYNELVSRCLEFVSRYYELASRKKELAPHYNGLVWFLFI